MNKFKVGDRVILVRNVSRTNTIRNIGDAFVIASIFEIADSKFGDIYYPKNEDGEYECDLELDKIYDSKLCKILR